MHRAVRRALRRARCAPLPLLVVAVAAVGPELPLFTGSAPPQSPSLAAAAVPDDLGETFRLVGAPPAAPVQVAPTSPAAAPKAAPARASRTAPRAARPFHRPAAGPLTSYYGQRWGKLHRGIDIGARHGAPVYAVTDGRIVSAATENGYGRIVAILGWDGVVTAYAHLSRFGQTGGAVSAGDVIGYVGSSGSATGPHLHFEVRKGGHAVDPLPYLRSHGLYR